MHNQPLALLTETPYDQPVFHNNGARLRPTVENSLPFSKKRLFPALYLKWEAKGVSPGADEALALPSKYGGAFRALQASAPHEGECGVYPSGQ